MTVRIYSVYEQFAPGVKVGASVVPVVVEATRRWNTRAALAAALERRGYEETSPDIYELGAIPAGRKGRPIEETLEQQAEKIVGKRTNPRQPSSSPRRRSVS